jgi:hypothetical protein
MLVVFEIIFVHRLVTLLFFFMHYIFRTWTKINKRNLIIKWKMKINFHIYKKMLQTWSSMLVFRKVDTNLPSIFYLKSQISCFHPLQYRIFKKVEIHRWIRVDIPRISFFYSLQIIFYLTSVFHLCWIKCLPPHDVDEARCIL